MVREKQKKKRWNLPYPLKNVTDSISWAQCHCSLLKALLASDVKQWGEEATSESSRQLQGDDA